VDRMFTAVIRKCFLRLEELAYKAMGFTMPHISLAGRCLEQEVCLVNDLPRQPEAMPR
jgi:hypothetical protein